MDTSAGSASPRLRVGGNGRVQQEKDRSLPQHLRSSLRPLSPGQVPGLMLWAPANLPLLIFCNNVSLKRCCVRYTAWPECAGSRGVLISQDLPVQFINPAIGTQRDGFNVRLGVILAKYCFPPLHVHQQQRSCALCNLVLWLRGVLAVPCARSSWGWRCRVRGWGSSGGQQQSRQPQTRYYNTRAWLGGFGVFFCMQTSRLLHKMQERGFVCLFL